MQILFKTKEDLIEYLQNFKKNADIPVNNIKVEQINYYCLTIKSE